MAWPVDERAGARAGQECLKLVRMQNGVQRVWEGVAMKDKCVRGVCCARAVCNVGFLCKLIQFMLFVRRACAVYAFFDCAIERGGA